MKRCEIVNLYLLMMVLLRIFFDIYTNYDEGTNGLYDRDESINFLFISYNYLSLWYDSYPRE